MVISPKVCVDVRCRSEMLTIQRLPFEREKNNRISWIRADGSTAYLRWLPRHLAIDWLENGIPSKDGACSERARVRKHVVLLWRGLQSASNKNQTTERIKPPKESTHQKNQTTKRIKPPKESNHQKNQTTKRIKPPKQSNHQKNQTTKRIKPPNSCEMQRTWLALVYFRPRGHDFAVAFAREELNGLSIAHAQRKCANGSGALITA
jgi:hypothetical protein